MGRAGSLLPRTTTFTISSPPGTIGRRRELIWLSGRTGRSEFVAKLEAVLPEIRERFGVAKIGIIGSIARGEDLPESDVDVLVELLPDHLTFRNFSALADFLEGLYWRKVDLLAVGGPRPCHPAGCGE